MDVAKKKAKKRRLGGVKKVSRAVSRAVMSAVRYIRLAKAHAERDATSREAWATLHDAESRLTRLETGAVKKGKSV
jgi:uncharacterized alpha-E superfamily protein